MLLESLLASATRRSALLYIASLSVAPSWPRGAYAEGPPHVAVCAHLCKPAPPPLVPPASAVEYECDDACKQRIADRRALFLQSRTTKDRQVMFDLSRQRAAMYNTTYQGASCIPGVPCW